MGAAAFQSALSQDWKKKVLLRLIFKRKVGAPFCPPRIHNLNEESSDTPKTTGLKKTRLVWLCLHTGDDIIQNARANRVEVYGFTIWDLILTQGAGGGKLMMVYTLLKK